MLDKLAYAVAGSGRPAFLAQLAEGLVIEAQSPASIHPEEGAVLATASFRNPWKVPVQASGLRLWHVTMGEMRAIEPPPALKSVAGAAWLDPKGFPIPAGDSVSGRLAFACKKITVSMPCRLEATPSLGAPSGGGVLCVPIEDLVKEAAKKATSSSAAPSPPAGA